MENLNQEDVFQRLKVKIYMFILPVIIIATGIGWTMDFFFSDDPITVSSFLFPFLGVWLLFCFLYIMIKNCFPRILELSSFSIVIIIYFIWFANTLSFNIKAGSLSGGLGEFTNWVPLFFILVVLIFNQKMALIVSFVILFTTIFIGIFLSFYYHQAFDIQTYDSLIQFYTSNAVYIVALFFLQSLKVAFIQKEAMQHLANTDYLTHLPNRRLVENRLNENINNNQEFSIILFDIDHFKSINDTYGHDIGDQVLIQFSRLIQENIRDNDIVARWGGEEFIIIVNNLGGIQAVGFADRLRNLIRDKSFTSNINVTASFGVAEYRYKERMKEVLKRADVALYLAKENGRNRVEVNL
jgi:diguanylate cyclase (GGDEF)-like protein